MKITHNKIGQNLNLNDALRSDKSKEKSGVEAAAIDQKTAQANKIKDLAANTGNDAVRIDLSSRAQDVRQAKELAMATPDVDQAKVEKFRKLIDEGKYKVDAKAVANKLVDEHMFGTLAGQGTDNE